MKIRTPAKRAYYPASPNEITRLLLWIPHNMMQLMVQEELLPAYLQEDYPDGLEVEVTEEAFEAYGIMLPVTPTQIKRAYVKLLVDKSLPSSRMVDGMALEAMAAGGLLPSFSIARSFPEPDMTDGEDPMTVLRRLQ